MEVIIDGIRHIPENQNFTTIRGVYYNNVAHWLYNIHAIMVNKWCDTVKDGENPDDSPELVALLKRIHDFEDYTKKYLGFKYVHEDGHYQFVECPDFDPISGLEFEENNPFNS